MLQQIVGSWNKNLGCYDVLWTNRWNRLLRIFSQIVAGTGLVDRFGFCGLGPFFFLKENWCYKMWALGLLTNGLGKGLSDCVQGVCCFDWVV